MIKQGKCSFRKESWAKVSKEASEFVGKLLIVDPVKRLSAEEALKEGWMAQRANIPQPQDVDQDTIGALASFAQASIFRRACMSVMAWSLSSDDRAQVRQAFEAIDTNHRGTITLGEFKKVMQDRFHIEDEQIMTSFEALDASHSEKIHYSDFLAAMVNSRIQIHDDVIAQTFRRFDVDNTGVITVANLKEVLGETFEAQEVDKLLDEADVDHDGKITKQEFIAYMKDSSNPGHHHEACHQVIDHHLRKGTSGTSSSSSKGPARLRPKEGAPDGKTAAAAAPAQPAAQKKGCCIVS